MLRFTLIFAFIYVLIFSILLLFDKNAIVKKILYYMAIVYKGFNSFTFKGILKGLIWSFFDGLLTGSIIYLLINLFAN
jgi:hypothetical protein